MAEVKRRRYNRFLHSDEQLPRSTLWRRSKNNLPKTSVENVPSTSAVSMTYIDSATEDFSEDIDVESEIIVGDQIIDFNSECDSEVEENFNTDNTTFSYKKNQLKFDNGTDLLYASSNVSTLEAYISILAFSIRFNLSRTCMQELLRLLEILLPPNNLPSTAHTFYRKMESAFDNVCDAHIYCIHCKSYICMLSSEQKPAVCFSCNEAFDPDECMKQGSFFLYMPLQPQLKVKFEKQNIMDDIEKYRSDFRSGLGKSYKDILDGNIYRSVSKNFSSNDVSLQFNVDGIPLFRKSQYNIWPIQCMINELSPSKRKDHLMMCGLWFGTSKPEMNENFLKPFVNEMSDLIENGFYWKRGTENILTKVYPLVCTSDAPARAMLQNFIQYNGRYGCGFCEAEGERVEKGRGFCRIYNVQPTLSPQRTCEKTVQYAEIALEEGKPHFGIKGPSTLMKLYPTFDLIDGFVPDYMHAVLLGVTRQFVCLWIETSSFLFSLSKKSVDILNDRIKDIKFTSETTRKLRSTKDLLFWKASEWRAFLLVSPVILLDILDKSVYKHWLLFVHGITLLLSENVSLQDLMVAEVALTKFVSDVCKIYGLAEQSYNVHLLLHLSSTVKSWGPLWAHSCFAYEDSLGKLKTFHHGTNAIPCQILSAYLNKANLKMLVNEENLQNPRVSSFIEDMQRGHSLTQKTLRVSDCILFGGYTIKLPRVEEKEILRDTNRSISIQKVKAYNRIMYTGKIYTTKDYCTPFSKADCIVSIKSGDIISKVEINKIIVFNDEVLFIGQKLSCKQFKKGDTDVGVLCSNIYILTVSDDDDFVDSNKIVVFRPTAIMDKCVIVSIFRNNHKTRYVIPLINASQQ